MRFLKKIREKQGVSATAFAISLGLSPQTYALYEKSGQRINIAILSQIREKLGISWSEYGRLIDAEAKKQS